MWRSSGIRWRSGGLRKTGEIVLRDPPRQSPARLTCRVACTALHLGGGTGPRPPSCKPSSGTPASARGEDKRKQGQSAIIRATYSGALANPHWFRRLP